MNNAGDICRKSRWQRALFVLAIGCSGLFIASCTPPTASLESLDQVDLSAKTPRKITNRGESPVPKAKSGQGKYELFPAAYATPLGRNEEPPPGVGAQNDGKFTVNIDQAPLPEAAQLILGETLGYTYIVDQRVQGSVSLVSNGSLSARELLSAFEASLRLTGAALIQSGQTFKIVALQEVLDGEMGKADFGKNISAGYGVNAIPLTYINPATLMELVDSFIARSGSVRASKVGNMVLIRGPSEERRALVDVVLSFDVDWMQAQNAGTAILENGRAEDVAKKVQEVFADDTAAAGPNALKLIPVPRINGIIAIANSRAKVRRALNWVKRLDQESITDANVYVYAVQNGNSAELSKLLQATFGTASQSAGATAEVAPDKDTMAVSMSGDQSGQPLQSTPEGANSEQNTDTAPNVDSNGAITGPEDPANMAAESVSTPRFAPNASNNTIIIRATPREYRKILAMLHQIDAPATQVLINTTIAEVALNDQLRYGVQAYLDNGDVGGGFLGSNTSSALTGFKIRPSIPGMNFFVGSISDPQVVIDALSGVTNVRVVSSPSILVLENETATIKVGDQVPVQTQTLVTDGGNSVNSFEYRDTGVILKVRPRVNANGVVTIELGQELSAVRPRDGVTAGNNPSFTQRSITSKVSVNDQQTVLLGGLISGRENQIRETVPGAKKLPVLGKLIGTTDNTALRNELIVFITPRIVRNGEDAARESQELRDKMRNLNFD